MEISRDRVNLICSPLYGFTGASAPVEVIVPLTVIIVSVVLITEQDDKQLPIYYVSKVLQGTELCCPSTEKLAFALFSATQKLRPYF
ncbi:hypothetical protein RJ639_039297 [Escallonia herrerae]|uniref:Reverse transcriptase/retrotransposon-derived protein RNase H-like domain-containing protein n=1 Tax=Escallonia herrerae TaxID=1293975 RepID=A0AA88WKG1_9ASTE|nr:hypothetical protein RJ639_039297 [Escallonia herrerae]